jgi:hypothetical protein
MSSSSSGGSEESLVGSQSQPLASRASYEPDEEDDSDNSFLPPFNRHRAHTHHKESSEGAAVLEALPLLRRPSIYLDRAKSNLSLGTGRGPS